MTNEASSLEGLKIRHDLFKHIGTTSLLINGGFLTLLRTVIDEHSQFAVEHFWLASWIIGLVGAALLLSIAGSEGVARSMRGEEPKANAFVKITMILVTFSLSAGIILLWIYGIHYAFIPRSRL